MNGQLQRVWSRLEHGKCIETLQLLDASKGMSSQEQQSPFLEATMADFMMGCEQIGCTDYTELGMDCMLWL